ncbi:hypothetical protein E6O51_19515 [Pseudothauera rhizosphaerae]|uniref:Tetratricopeptide repeat protein n=1 Tax=Pseudothauera rhizosphaerae TaxID=2565932 RepID=A0A4S4AB71_9RHOO|nr:hypothetical protein E6O51_19515 [Pseudothauera rhizosphaerae]
MTAAITALWLLHPINVVPIIMPVQRMTLLAASFGLLTIIAHLHWLRSSGARSYAWLIAAWLVCWPLAMLSKETALTIPFIALVIGLTTSRGRKTSITTAALLVASLAAVLAAALMLGTGWLERAYEARTFTLEQRMLTEARVLWYYAAQIVFPRFDRFGLFLDDFPLSNGLLDPTTTLLSIIGWVAAITVAIVLRKRIPLFSLGVGWFLAGHLLESTIVPLEIAFEHRNYLPSVGLLLAAAGLLDMLRKAVPPSSFRPVAMLLFAGLFLYCSAVTFMRSMHFSDGLRFAFMEVQYHPKSPRANLAAGTALMDAGYGAGGDFASQAIVYHLLEAAKLDPSHKIAYVYLLVLSCGTQKQPDMEWIAELESRLRYTPYSPQDKGLASRLGKLAINPSQCLDHGTVHRLFLAGADSERAPAEVRASFLEHLGDYSLLVEGNLAQSRALLQRALTLAPGNAQLRHKLNGLNGYGRNTEAS